VRLSLPYSGDEFSLPSNLYIIGTMNTADRSIALIDTALRRRFEFVETPPLPNNLSQDVEGVNVRALLSAINERIEYLFDRDHLIGHAFFIGLQTIPELDAVMRRKVIPLLAEYFYEDWERVRAVIGETEDVGGFIERRPLSQPPLLSFDGAPEQRWCYSIRLEAFTRETFQRVYAGQ
jgi:5-methylcytosine-specific restriction protein B